MSRNYKSQFMRLCFVLPMVFLGACGDDDALVINEEEKVVIKTGSFIDSAVSGIEYSTATRSGTTNSFGEFNYIEGEIVTFSIGKIVLPPAKAAFILTPIDLVGNDADETNITALNITRLLLTIDTDSISSNGIQISDDVFENATMQLDFSVSIEEFSAEGSLGSQLINSLGREFEGSALTMVDKDTAESHLLETIDGIEKSKFTNEFLSDNTFSVVHDDGEIDELYFAPFIVDGTNTGIMKHSDGAASTITAWQVTENDGELHFTAFNKVPTKWEFIGPTTTASTANYTYQRPDLSNDIPAEGNMTLIEHAFKSSFLLGEYLQGNIFNVNHEGSNLTILSFVEVVDSEGELEPFTGLIVRGDDAVKFNWSIDLGVLTITENITGNDTSLWKFTASSITEEIAEYNYSRSFEVDGDEFIANGPGEITLNKNVFSKNYLMGESLNGNTFNLGYSDTTSSLTQLSFVELLDTTDEAGEATLPMTGTLVRGGESYEFQWSLELGVLTIIESVDVANKFRFISTSLLESGIMEYDFTETIKVNDEVQSASGNGMMTLVVNDVI